MKVSLDTKILLFLLDVSANFFLFRKRELFTIKKIIVRFIKDISQLIINEVTFR